MRSIRQKVWGKLFVENGRAVLWRTNDETPVAGVTPDRIILRYALTIRGPEFLIFPAIVVMDYGEELRKLRIYDWLRDNGDYYPRSEVFGYLQSSGAETQHFLREIELHYKYPIFAYPSLETPLQDGIPLDKIVLTTDDDDAPSSPIKTKRPTGTPSPLRRAVVEWWQMPASQLPTFTPATLT